ncbi:MAG TPA: aldo/keto reductase, partial [Byssovorax sp.]
MSAHIGIGCLRLSDGAVDEARAVDVIVTAIDAGATRIDTADVYAPSEHEIGHGERLVARALAASRARGAARGES